MFAHSIRWRFQLWLALLLACVLTGFGVAVYELQRRNLLTRTAEEITHRVTILTSAVRGEPPGHGPGSGRPGFRGGQGKPDFHNADQAPGQNHRDGPFGSDFRFPPGAREINLPSRTAGLFDEADTNSYYFAIWSHDRELLKKSTNAPADLQLPGRSREADAGTDLRVHGDFQQGVHFTELGDCILVGRSIIPDLTVLHRFAWLLLAAGGAVLALGLGGGWWLTSSAFRPIEQISAAATRISAGNLSERIQTADSRNELGSLADVLNSTFARLEAAFVRQRQFTADAAHELRTPLAVIITEAQTILTRDRDASEYREAVQACLDTAQQMRKLTDSLLELARFEAARDAQAADILDLAETARTCIAQITPLAAKHSLKIETNLAPANCRANADLLGHVVTNLLSNAIYYNKPGGEIRVRTGMQNGSAFLSVADTGIGIASEDLPLIFERFYRADKSRSHSEGHTGLGLAICKAIIDAANGKIEVTSQPDVGSTFTVRIPVN